MSSSSNVYPNFAEEHSAVVRPKEFPNALDGIVNSGFAVVLSRADIHGVNGKNTVAPNSKFNLSVCLYGAKESRRDKV